MKNPLSLTIPQRIHLSERMFFHVFYFGFWPQLAASRRQTAL
jgi:hypothetical protein